MSQSPRRRSRKVSSFLKAEALQRAILRSATFSSIATDVHGIIQVFNVGAERMLGYSAAEVVDAVTPADLSDPQELIDRANALSRELGTTIAPGFEALVFKASRGLEDIYELTYVRKDGTRLPAVVSVTALFDSTETIIGYLLIGTDNVARKRAASELQRLQSAALHAAADAIVIAGRSGAVEWVNPAFTRLTGRSAQDTLGVPLRQLSADDDVSQQRFSECWEAVCGGRPWRGEGVNHRTDGSAYNEDQVVAPIRNELGAITHVIAVTEDITARLALEAQFRQAHKMETVGQLASGIAHDFNNLLTVINGMAELVMESVGDTHAVHDDVEEIRRAGDRAAALTRQLLTFSRQQIQQVQVVNLGSVLTGMASLLKRLLDEDIELKLEAAEDEGRVSADPGQLEQVLANLVVNARDAMPEGGRLTIAIERQSVAATAAADETAPGPGAYVLLTVTDNGVGMERSTQERIFEPFFTTKGPGCGTGLGLSTVHSIVKQSGGFIEVESVLGTGTSFKVFLPETSAELTVKAAAASVRPRAGTETILLVEDDPGLRRLVTRVLERAGYHLLVAPNGERALRLMEDYDKRVHLLLSDVVMPGMNGYALGQLLGQRHHSMRVLYMSGYSTDATGRHPASARPVPFLEKPFSGTALLRRVREILDSSIDPAA